MNQNYIQKFNLNESFLIHDFFMPYGKPSHGLVLECFDVLYIKYLSSLSFIIILLIILFCYGVGVNYAGSL